MKAMVCRRYGTPDVLELKEMKIPIPEDDEVLVKVHASSINSWDWDYVRGTPLSRISGGLIKPKYGILGADIAGKVIAVGRSVTQFASGDAVFGDISGSGWGGFAEYVCARENVLAMKSPDMSFEEAAAVPQAGLLALQALTGKGYVKQGDKILINGAGGGVGTFAVQIAKSFGAEVTGVDSGGKLNLIRSIGADHVIDYTKEDYTQNDERYDWIIDVVAHRSVFEYKRILNSSGMFVMVGGSTARILQFLLFGPWISMTADKKMNVMIYKPDKEGLNQMNELFESGEVKPVIDKSYELADTAEAIQYLGDGHVQGKVVITIN